MKILFNALGEILGVGEVDGGEEIQDIFPEDFINTFALGKYTIIAGKIKENLSLVMPESPQII